MYAAAAAGPNHLARAMQEFGLLSVVFTAVGCQYFVFSAETNLASRAGLDAVGIFVLLLNAVFVLVMTLLIVRAARKEVVVVLERVLDKVNRAGKTFWTKIRIWQHTKLPTSDGVALTTNQPSQNAVFLMPAHRR